MLDEGVYLAPSQFEAAFVSLAHTDEVIEQTIEAAQKSQSVHDSCRSVAQIGRSILNFEPFPGSLATLILPPCCSTICFTIARPKSGAAFLR